MHARALLRAAERRASADRHSMAGDTNRAEIASDEAAEALADAAALRDVLVTLGAYVHEDPRQLVLLQFPEAA
jgi:hypothetical protein